MFIGVNSRCAHGGALAIAAAAATAAAVAQASTVTGTIVATREGAVRVEVPQGGEVEPAIGNAVRFTIEIRG
jgi:hypothetical protein